MTVVAENDGCKNNVGEYLMALSDDSCVGSVGEAIAGLLVL